MRASAVALLALLAVASAASSPSFTSWLAQSGKAYSSLEEYALRSKVYAANIAMIEAHNAAAARGEHTWTMGVNSFADLTPEEFAARYIGGLRPQYRSGGYRFTHKAPKLSQVPASWDWSAKGAVTPIKNQEQCGSCWAFSTTGSVEGINFIATGNLLSLSEQQLVDCSGSFGNDGCNGGLMDNAFKYIISVGGLCSEASYPYTAQDGTCKAKTCAGGFVANISGYTDVTADNDADFVAAVYQQPVSIAVEADQASFQFYTSGVMTAACGTQLDHGVLAVGWGELNNVEYFKVKNSWGATWGMSGYILLARGTTYNKGKGQCGIYTTASYPTK